MTRSFVPGAIVAQRVEAQHSVFGAHLQRKCACAAHSGGDTCKECEERKRRWLPQSKLSIDVPGDPFEREADAIADRFSSDDPYQFTRGRQSLRVSSFARGHAETEIDIPPPVE